MSADIITMNYRHITNALLSIVAIAVIVGTIPAFSETQVDIPKGASTPGCETTNECFIPNMVKTGVDGTVTWKNNDSAAHTVTSGEAKTGPDGKFDSSIIASGGTFSHKFDKLGEYPYFCVVHPWMTGTVLVTVSDDNAVKVPLGTIVVGSGEKKGITQLSSMSEDGSIIVKISTTDPKSDKTMTIDVDFINKDHKNQEHVNYDISAMQSGKEVLSEKGAHTHNGKATHETSVLSSDEPVDIKVTLNGIGISAPFTGPQGDTVQFNVVPEFGPIALIVLTVAIISTLYIARSKVIPRL